MLLSRTAILSLMLGLYSSLAAVDPPTLPDLKVGKNLQASVTLALKHPAPDEGMEIVISSADPSKLLFSRDIFAKGTPTVVLPIRGGFKASPEFWVQAQSDAGTVEYTASSSAFGKATGTVALSKSGMILIGPFRAPSFNTTPRGIPMQLAIQSVRLDDDGKVAEQQYIAGGLKASVQIKSSTPNVGTLTPSTLEFEGGSAVAGVEFQAAQVGKTSISLEQPPGFTTPAERTSVTAVVGQPGILLSDNLFIGKELQVAGLVGLGEQAPPGGVTITITSSDPRRLLLSASADQPGAGKLEIRIPAGGVNSPFYLQALDGSGTVTCTASAPGYQTRTREVTLTPAGVVIMFAAYGPPDEAEVLRKEAASPTVAIYASMAKQKQIPFNVWTVRLDPVTLRGADITVQQLRAGHKLNIAIQNSNPAVGKITSSVIITGGSDFGTAILKPLKPGDTVVSVVTPPGLVRPSNSTTVTAHITE